jgi:ferrous iron transport protein B
MTNRQSEEEDKMGITIALAGNPNSGKTTLFNSLTGSSQRVGNWPGVTVEKKEGKLKGHKDVTIQDLPGIYSLSPYTLEEVVTRRYLANERPDAIINIIDGTNLERNLYLTTQILELGIPTIIAVNMIDVVQKNGDSFNLANLEDALGAEVLEISALKGIGINELITRSIELVNQARPKEISSVFEGTVEHAIAHIEESLESVLSSKPLRWYAIKVFERDEKVLEELGLEETLSSHLEEHIRFCEEEYQDRAESIITDQRYLYISELVKTVMKKNVDRMEASWSDRIDRVITNRILALPIFALVMFFIYYISISTVGGYATDWANDTFFGELVAGNLNDWFEATSVAPWLSGLIVEGIIGGVGAVLGFVPQMFILFLLLSIFEEIGYMARVAFIMDRIFRKFGLSGKSFIPMLISSGCGVPGIMACRTIENERDRRMTIMTTTFVPCGAKMPIVALLAGALFGGSGLIATSAYFIGVGSVIVSGIILKKTRPFAGEAAPFVMELPAYHIPSPSNVLRATWERGWSFIKRAGTIILISAIVLWFLQAFGVENGSLQMVEDNNTSLLAAIGVLIAPVFAPLGFGDWKATVATFTGLIAKENVVGTFGVLYGVAEVAEDGVEIWANLAASFTPLAAFSFLVFNLLCAPCFAAIGAIRREMSSGKWTWAAIGYQTGYAYVIALIVYQLGLVFSGNPFGVGSAVAILLLGLMMFMLFRKSKYNEYEKPLKVKGEWTNA